MLMAVVIGGLAGIIILIAALRMLRARKNRQNDTAFAADRELAAEIARSSVGMAADGTNDGPQDITLEMMPLDDTPLQTDTDADADLSIPRMGEETQADPMDISAVPEPVEDIPLDTPRASLKKATQKADARGGEDEIEKLAEIERKMLALKELHENGLIATEVYILKAREYASQGIKKRFF